MASSNLVLLLILVSFINFATSKAQDLGFFASNCLDGQTITANSPFQLNLRTLLSSLSSKATSKFDFYNTTVRGGNPSDTVYGLFMCRGDIPSQLCGECVQNAVQNLSSDCSLKNRAVIWYDECMVRYSDRSFFSKMEKDPIYAPHNVVNVSNHDSFMRLLWVTMNATADEAAKSSIGAKKYAAKEANISAFQNLYTLTQCTQDLSPEDCRTCLAVAIGKISSCCDGKEGGRVVSLSCYIRYELYPFFRSSTALEPAPLVLATKSSNRDSNYSEDSGYLSHNCSRETFTEYGYWSQTREILLSSLKVSDRTDFHTETTDDNSRKAYGHFMCRADLPLRLCHQCVLNATTRISSECSALEEGIIWYNHCLLRYSYRPFSFTGDTVPRFEDLNITNIPNQNRAQNSISWILGNAVSRVITDTSRNVNSKYATKSVKLNDLQTVYTLAQCTVNLSIVDCERCLCDLMGSTIPWHRLGSVGGRVIYPSCNVRFELFQFYRDGADAGLHSPGRRESSNGRARTIIAIVVPTIFLMMLFAFGCYLRRRKLRKSKKIILQENFGLESATLEALQFDLETIQGATNNFSHENMIGKGGFGEVYKGILSDGRYVAVKKLSSSSRQGVIEFKNEILLIAKLQHRNLVTLMGFCLEEREKILIYEYVPNHSLDCFLFGTQLQKSLNWSQRQQIIGGIARGILYLHEYSRLKIIHRDLKPSNILLDENMNPKIADFGMARIVDIDQDQGSTNRIVGTYGYMSPEYAMFGRFSEKSDVYSFGIIVLEIISGIKNISSLDSYSADDGLIRYVWRMWREETPLSLLDQNLKENCSEIEVIKCIQIGLLCVQENPDARPTMATVLSYLNSSTIELPYPEQPAFFMPGKMNPKELVQESSSNQSANEMSISNLLPR